jgi:hypothetical protein
MLALPVAGYRPRLLPSAHQHSPNGSDPLPPISPDVLPYIGNFNTNTLGFLRQVPALLAQRNSPKICHPAPERLGRYSLT